MTQDSGRKLYARAKQLIPGGTQLLSKRPEMFLPDLWPTYYSRAKGCEVWDLDGKRYIDMTSSGIGACLLGFADDDVNAAVKQQVDAGSMCTLNSAADVELAELLCEIHPWAQKVRYARAGGEAMSIAVRIARAHTGRDTIAFCGYHGWSDWYLAANLSDGAALEGHLLPGLDPAGVPAGLRGSAIPFSYNDAAQLERITERHGPLAAIVMEPARLRLPENGFLQRVREIADRTGAVLVFDEITAGWRHNFGGMHLQLEVTPDIAVFAKAMSNGFPMAAIIGRAAVMDAAQRSFISSTYWTESIGPAAAIACIRKMQRVRLWEHTQRIGQMIQTGWSALIAKHNLKALAEGPYPLSHLKLDYGPQTQAIRTLLTQLMLEAGYLATDTVYVTYAHTPAIVEEYLAALDKVLATLAEAIVAGDVNARLKSAVAHSGFQRLT
jgi:glutamate-1-semialdehyde aminotransferase